MIWTEELSASLDQSGGAVVFNRIEVTRAQQLAQLVADKVGAMLEQNEKTLDVKMGGTGGWNERTDGAKGEKRGEQTQERKGRNTDRTRGSYRGDWSLPKILSRINSLFSAQDVDVALGLLRDWETRWRVALEISLFLSLFSICMYYGVCNTYAFCEFISRSCHS